MDPNQDMSMTCKIDLRDMVQSLKGFTKSKQPLRSIEAKQIVDLFAEEVKFLRSTQTRLSTIVPALLAKLGIPKDHPIFKSGAPLSLLAQETGNQPTYHNEQHIIEVVVAAYCLGRREHLPTTRLGELIIAATAHDLGHTGKINSTPYELETRSYEIAHPHLSEAQWDEASLHRMWQMIVATDFKNGVPQVRKAYKETRHLPFDNEQRLLATQCVLLTEADILFSCFDSDYNDLLSKLLSAEWQRPGDNLTVKERIGFLSSVEFVSDAARQLGLEDRRKALIDQLNTQPPKPPVAKSEL